MTVEQFIKRVDEAKCWPFHFKVIDDLNRIITVYTRLRTKDSINGEPVKTARTKSVTVEEIHYMDDRALARWLFALVMSHAEHELSESFTFNGGRPFWPHDKPAETKTAAR